MLYQRWNNWPLHTLVLIVFISFQFSQILSNLFRHFYFVPKLYHSHSLGGVWTPKGQPGENMSDHLFFFFPLLYPLRNQRFSVSFIVKWEFSSYCSFFFLFPIAFTSFYLKSCLWKEYRKWKQMRENIVGGYLKRLLSPWHFLIHFCTFYYIHTCMIYSSGKANILTYFIKIRVKEN